MGKMIFHTRHLYLCIGFAVAALILYFTRDNNSTFDKVMVVVNIVLSAVYLLAFLFDHNDYSKENEKENKEGGTK